MMESPQPDSGPRLHPVSASISSSSERTRFSSRKTNTTPKSTDQQLTAPTANTGPEEIPPDTRCHFFKIPIELRDDIYDYVACAEKKPGLHVNLETATEPKLHAYDQGLSQTCSQTRQEYGLRLQHHIKQLTIDHRASDPEDKPTMIRQLLRGQAVHIAESQASKGVWNQDDVALRITIPFRGAFDDCKSYSTLTFIVASSATRDYNLKFAVRGLGTFDRQRLPAPDLVFALGYLSALKAITELDTRNWWTPLWTEYAERRVAYTNLQDMALQPQYRGLPMWSVYKPTSLLAAEFEAECIAEELVTRKLRPKRWRLNYA
jgi:hypothetical protein